MRRLLNHPRAIIFTPLLLLGLLSAYYLLARYQPAQITEIPRPAPQTQSLNTFSENGVTVEIAWEQDASGQAWLMGTFTPLEPGFHVYSKDLPKEGVRGQGRPTLIEIVSPSEVKPRGPLQADQPVEDHYVRAINQSIPIYPAGPVTLRLPITLPKRGSTPVELAITYASCSNFNCLEPVIDKRVSVVIGEAAGR